MNKLILCLFVALTASMIHVRWSTARLNTFFDDFVSFPSLKVKRDLEFEEFLKDGNMKEAQKRAFHRQKRANEENMSDILKRARRNLAEAEEEEDDDEIQRRCSAEEHNGIERDTCFQCVPFREEPIKVYFGDQNGCGDVTRSRVGEVTAMYTEKSECRFHLTPVSSPEEADIVFQCDPNDGNYAPLGKSALHKIVNLQEINGGKAGYKIIDHEVGHLCCLQHTQKLKGSGQVETKNTDCILPGYETQFDEMSCTNECSKYFTYPLTVVNPSSNMQYKTNTFAKDSSCETLIPNHPSLATFNARKTAWYSEIALIQEAYCVSCPPVQLGPNEVLGKDCSILAMEVIANADDIVIEQSPMCLDPTEVSVSGGESKTFKCSSGSVYMVVSKFSWEGMKDHSTCKTESMRAVGKKDGQLGEIAIVCGTGSDQVDYTLKCVEGEFITIDGSASTSGVMKLEVTTC